MRIIEPKKLLFNYTTTLEGLTDAKMVIPILTRTYTGDTAEVVKVYDEILKRMRSDLKKVALMRIRSNENATELLRLLFTPEQTDDDDLRSFLDMCSWYVDRHSFSSLTYGLASVGVTRAMIERLSSDECETPLYQYLVANLD